MFHSNLSAIQITSPSVRVFLKILNIGLPWTGVSLQILLVGHDLFAIEIIDEAAGIHRTSRPGTDGKVQVVDATS